LTVVRQLKTRVKIYNVDPMNHHSQDSLIDEFDNLSTIFNQDITVIDQEKNPIKELIKEENIIQILPLKEAMFERRLLKFTSLNTDLLSFDTNKYNQILIPVIENDNKNTCF